MMSLCRLFVLSLCILCCTADAMAQLQTFSQLTNGSGYRIKPAKDNGFYAAGVAYDNEGRGAYWLLKFDDKAKLEWSKLFGYEKSVVQLWSLVVTSNNDAIISGYAGSPSDSKLTLPLMYRVNDKGEQVKELILDYTYDDHFHWFEPAPEGGYYFAGHSDSKGDVKGDVWVSRLDDNYKPKWDKVFDNNYDHAHAGVIMQNNGIALAGHTQNGFYTKSWLLRIDTTGKILWSITPNLEDLTYEDPYDIARTKDDGVVIVGSRIEPSIGISSLFILVTDANGKIILDSSYNSGNTSGWSGMQTSDGGYVMTGYSTISGINFPFVIKINQTGHVQWQSNIDESLFGGAYGVVQAGKQYLVTGDNDAGELWVAVLDSNGRLTSLALDVKQPRATTAGGAKISVYPNPSNTGNVTFSFNGLGAQVYSVNIYDALGRTVKAFRVNGGMQRNTLQWDGTDFSGSALPNGEYYIKATTSKGIATEKLILNR